VNVILKFEKTISTGTYTFATCNEQYEYKVGGQTFNKANPAGQVLLTGAAAKSCDSLLNVQLIFSDFDVMQTIVYNCGSADASLRFSSASHTGPYTISIDGINSPVFQTLPGGVAIKPGAHNIVFSNTEGCKKSFALNVDDTNAPEVTLSQTPANDGTVQINVVALQNTIYDLVWTPSNTLSCKNCTDPIANPPETTTYTLNYNFGKDCNDNRSITIEREIIDVIIPNIFSPDGNGTNDIFYVQLPDKVNGTVKSMNIYDRWGNLVFAAKDRPASVPAEGWNGIVKGIAVQPGVYVYYIELQLTGSQLNDIFSGTVIVIR
jgi:gliding motility-associated-like protein